MEKLTLDEVLQKIPKPWQPVAAQYGPALAAMTADEIWAWINLLAMGDTKAAYQTLVSRLNNADLLAQWDTLQQAWSQANAENAAKLALQREAGLAVLKVALGMALVMVGL